MELIDCVVLTLFSLSGKSNRGVDCLAVGACCFLLESLLSFCLLLFFFEIEFPILFSLSSSWGNL